MGINEILQVGNNIKKLRTEKKLTQKEMAKKLNIPYSTYSNYENNNREPNRELLEKIADVLEVTIDELIGWDKNKGPIENIKNSPIAAEMICDTINKTFNKSKAGKIYQISFNTENYSLDELRKILEYAEFIKSRNEKK